MKKKGCAKQSDGSKAHYNLQTRPKRNQAQANKQTLSMYKGETHVSTPLLQMRRPPRTLPLVGGVRLHCHVALEEHVRRPSQRGHMHEEFSGRPSQVIAVRMRYFRRKWYENIGKSGYILPL